MVLWKSKIVSYLRIIDGAHCHNGAHLTRWNSYSGILLNMTRERKSTFKEYMIERIQKINTFLSQKHRHWYRLLEGFK